MAVADNIPEVASPSKRKEVVRRLFGREKMPVKEVPEMPEIPREIEKGQTVPGAMVQLPKPVTDDQGQVLLTSPVAQTPKINLPLTQDQINQGLKYDIVYSFRWLAEWCWRVIKKLASRFKETKR